MKDLLPVEVECYSGFRADEYPVRFFLDSVSLDIVEIIDRWHQVTSTPGSPASDYFKVRTRDDKLFILKHEHENDKWYLWIKGESLNLSG
jgi:hypothetical protein